MERLHFDTDDEDEFEATRDRLLDEYARWLGEHRGPDDHELDDDARIFLDWRFGYSTGELDRYTPDDLHEFFVEWCPRKLSAPAEIVGDLVRSVTGLVEFLAATGRLEGGAAAAARLIVAAEDLLPEASAAMSDPANFGMAKSLFGADLADALNTAGSEEEMQAILDDAMEQFNALPDEERRAATDRFVERRPPMRELPYILIASDPDEVAASAAAAPVLARFERLRAALTDPAIVGPDAVVAGITFTEDDAIELDIARRLVEALETGDPVDPVVDGRVITSETSFEFVGLMHLVAWAEAAGAIRLVDDHVLLTDAWATADAEVRAADAFAALIEIGAVASRGSGPAVLEPVDDLIDDGIVPWMAILAPPDNVVPVALIDQMVREACARQISSKVLASLDEHLPDYLRRQTSTVLDTLVTAGVLTWTGRGRVGGSDATPFWIGGDVALTELGRHLLPRHLERIGASIRVVDDPTVVTAEQLLELLVMSGGDPSELAERWWPDRHIVERASAIADAIHTSPDAERRIAGFVALGHIGPPESVAPIVRQMLDSPVAGHAAMFLLEKGLATDDEVGDFLDEGPLIDMLASVTSDPDVMATLFLRMRERVDDVESVIQRMWRHPAAETAEVLEVLGRHLPDKKLAKAARRALVQHRSWMADPNR